jgi:hypothetical protein
MPRTVSRFFAENLPLFFLYGEFKAYCVFLNTADPAGFPQISAESKMAAIWRRRRRRGSRKVVEKEEETIRTRFWQTPYTRRAHSARLCSHTEKKRLSHALLSRSSQDSLEEGEMGRQGMEQRLVIQCRMQKLYSNYQYLL